MPPRKDDPTPDLEAQLRQGFGELAGLVTGHAEALVAAQRALLDGAETVTGLAFAFARERLAKGLELHKGLAACGSPQQAAELQVAFARETLEAVTRQGREVGESVLKAAGACWQPLQTRAAAVSEKAETGLAA